MKRLAKLATLSLTAGMLLAACGDATDNDEGVEDPQEEGLDDGRDEEDGIYGDDEVEDEELDDDGMDDDLDDDGMDDDLDDE
ncbi:hypothetical protein [Alkalibacterium sp.]|nr:MAG: DNA primase [Alkalibacterium sp.]